MTETLEQTFAEVEELRRQQAGNYNQLVRQIHAGEKLGAAFINDTLRAADKTPDDLRNDVLRLENRCQLRKLVDAKLEANGAIAEMQRQLEAINRQLEQDVAEAEQRHREASLPIQTALADARNAISKASDAERELRQTCNPELEQRMKSLNQHMHHLEHGTSRSAQEAKEARRDRLARELAQARQNLAEAKSDQQRTQFQGEIDRLTTAHTAAVAAADELGNANESVQARINELYQEMLLP